MEAKCYAAEDIHSDRGGEETAINLASSSDAATAFSSNPMMLNSKILFPIGRRTKEDGRESGLPGLRRVGIGGRGPPCMMSVKGFKLH